MRSSAFVAPVSRVAAPVVRASEVNMFYSGPVTGIQVWQRRASACCSVVAIAPKPRCRTGSSVPPSSPGTALLPVFSPSSVRRRSRRTRRRRRRRRPSRRPSRRRRPRSARRLGRRRGAGGVKARVSSTLASLFAVCTRGRRCLSRASCRARPAGRCLSHLSAPSRISTCCCHLRSTSLRTLLLLLN